MDKNGINVLSLSHNFRMENVEKKEGVTISLKEAEDYCAYKRQKKINEIMQAMRRSESELTVDESAVKLCERASRLRQSSIRMRPSELLQRGEIFKRSPLKIDCIVGGNGETFPKAKAFEAKCAVKEGAKELTLVLTASLIENCRYQEIRKEVKRVKRAAKKIPVKVQVEKAYQNMTMLRLAKICSQVGVAYFSVPYFSGCHLLQAELSNGCVLEVYNVQTLEHFQEMAGVCTGRIVTNHAWDIYNAWLKEVEKIKVNGREPSAKEEEKASRLNEEKAENSVSEEGKVALPTTLAEAKPVLPALPLKAPTNTPLLTAKPTDCEADCNRRIEDGKLKFS